MTHGTLSGGLNDLSKHVDLEKFTAHAKKVSDAERAGIAHIRQNMGSMDEAEWNRIYSKLNENYGQAMRRMYPLNVGKIWNREGRAELKAMGRRKWLAGIKRMRGMRGAVNKSDLEKFTAHAGLYNKIKRNLERRAAVMYSRGQRIPKGVLQDMLNAQMQALMGPPTGSRKGMIGKSDVLEKVLPTSLLRRWAKLPEKERNANMRAWKLKGLVDTADYARMNAMLQGRAARRPLGEIGVQYKTKEVNGRTVRMKAGTGWGSDTPLSQKLFGRPSPFRSFDPEDPAFKRAEAIEDLIHGGRTSKHQWRKMRGIVDDGRVGKSDLRKFTAHALAALQAKRNKRAAQRWLADTPDSATNAVQRKMHQGVKEAARMSRVQADDAMYRMMPHRPGGGNLFMSDELRGRAAYGAGIERMRRAGIGKSATEKWRDYLTGQGE